MSFWNRRSRCSYIKWNLTITISKFLRWFLCCQSNCFAHGIAICSRGSCVITSCCWRRKVPFQYKLDSSDAWDCAHVIVIVSFVILAIKSEPSLASVFHVPVKSAGFSVDSSWLFWDFSFVESSEVSTFCWLALLSLVVLLGRLRFTEHVLSVPIPKTVASSPAAIFVNQGIT